MWFGFAQLQKYYDYGRGVSVCQLRLKNKTNPKHQESMKWVKEKGLLDYTFIYAPFDEHSNEVVPDVAKWCRKWKEESDIPILDCFYGSNVQPLFGLVDIWLGQNPKQEWAKERKKKGDRFFAVNSSLIWHIEYEPVGGRAAFWQDHASGYDGRYVYSTCRWTNDLFKKNWTSGNYMGSAVYPSPDGVTTSIRFEAMRDGIDDYEYLSILKRLVEKNVGSGVAAVKEAKAILADEQLGKKLKSVDDLYAMRAKVADLIAELTEE